MSNKFNIKVRSVLGAKTDDVFHYLVPLLEKDPDYVSLHAGTNNAVDHKSNDIISKIFYIERICLVTGTQLQGYNFKAWK